MNSALNGNLGLSRPNESKSKKDDNLPAKECSVNMSGLETEMIAIEHISIHAHLCLFFLLSELISRVTGPSLTSETSM